MISDQHAADLLHRVMELAIAVRDLGADDVQQLAADILTDAGDPVVALTVAAAAIRVDRPVDRWWQRLDEAPLSAEHGRRILYGVATGIDCATPSWQALAAHKAADQEPCQACTTWRDTLLANRKTAVA